MEETSVNDLSNQKSSVIYQFHNGNFISAIRNANFSLAYEFKLCAGSAVDLCKTVTPECCIIEKDLKTKQN